MQRAHGRYQVQASANLSAGSSEFRQISGNHHGAAIARIFFNSPACAWALTESIIFS
jgi:hypothetical protein